MWRSEVNTEHLSLWFCIFHLTQGLSLNPELTDSVRVDASETGGSWACRLTQPQPFTWGIGIRTQALMLSKHTFHPQSQLQSLILFSMESLNSRTSVIVQTAISHYSLSYFGYTITTEFSGSPSLSVSPSPSLRPCPLGLLYRCLSHLGMSPTRNLIISELPSVLLNPLHFFQSH